MGRSGSKAAANRQARRQHAPVIRGSRREHAPTATPRSTQPGHPAHAGPAAVVAASEPAERQAPRQIEWPLVEDPGPAKRSSRPVPYEKSLQHRNKAVAAEWHPTLNRDLRPQDVSVGEHTLRWWLCPGKLSPDGTVFVRHAYQATTGNRRKGRGCPYCSMPAKKVCPYTNSLRARNPELADELHPTLNKKTADEIIAGSSKETCWWLCPGKLDVHDQWHQHEYPASPANRIKGRGCPYCSVPAQKPCPRCNTLSAKHENLAKELHPTLNTMTADEIIAGSGDMFWWLCPGKPDAHGDWHQHEYEASASRRMKGHGCPCCSTPAKKPCPRCNTLSAKHEALAQELHPTRNTKTADEIIAGSDKPCWWLCPGKLDAHGRWHQHEYPARPNDRIKGRGCPYCSVPAQKPCPRCNTLSAKHENLAKELHPTLNTMTADEIIAGSNEPCWWLCPGKLDARDEWHQHEYKASPNDRIKGNGCPCCSTPAKKPCPRCNTLSAKDEDLAKELHPTRNTKTADEIIAGSDKPCWWLCPGKLDAHGRWHQHEYPARPNDRINGTGCPDCSKIQRVRHRPQAFQQALAAADLDELAALQSERERRRWLGAAGASEHGNGGAWIILEGIVRGFVSEHELREFVQAPNPEALTLKLRNNFALVKLIEREDVPKRIRKQVRAHDHGQCCLCSSTKNLEVDHLLARSLGGTNNPDNLWTLCQPCNGSGGKHAKLPDQQILEVWVATGRGKPACWDDVWEGTGKTPPAWPGERMPVEQAA